MNGWHVQRECACLSADMSSSLSSPSELKISDQAQLDDLLSGRGQDARDARHNVRSLHIRGVKRIRKEWPRLPSLEQLTITADIKTLAEFSRVLRASACLKLECPDDFLSERWAHPVLEGRFEQLNGIQIKYFRTKRNAFHSTLSCGNSWTFKGTRLAMRGGPPRRAGTAALPHLARHYIE